MCELSPPSNALALPGSPLSRRATLALGAGLGLLALADVDDAAAATNTQTGWRFCPRCRGMFRSAKNKPAGVCPAGGKHKPFKPFNYVMIFYRAPLVPGMTNNFGACTKCLGMATPSEDADSVCPKGGQHKSLGGTEFQLWSGEPVPFVMDADAWDWCRKCWAIFNFGGGELGVCPAGDGHQRNGGLFSPVFLT